MSQKKVFGINGFGRIGRTSLRVWWEHHQDTLALSVINTSGSMEIEEWAHLLKYDTNYGVFAGNITSERYQSKKEVTDENPVLGTLILGDSHKITVTAQRDPNKIPWGHNFVETVIESTGVFTNEEKASLHFAGGAKRVVISAPADGTNIETVVIGASEGPGSTPVISNASCTTNCIAPIAEIMTRTFGVEKAMLTTVHSYTDDQNTHDNSHRKDLRRARAAAQNIIPTSTGAAKAAALVVPQLKGLFDGLAVRVPTPVGSLSDLVFVLERDTTIEEVNKILSRESESQRYHGILAVTSDPIVSSDIIGRRESSIVDLSLTNVVGGNLVKIIAWYDNEYGYCNRLVEQILN